MIFKTTTERKTHKIRDFEAKVALTNKTLFEEDF